MKDKCFIYLIDAPLTENVNPSLKKVFGDERAVHIYKDMAISSYKTAQSFESSSIVISYKRSHKYPDLTWLDENDPGFLEAKTDDMAQRIYLAFRWAFNAGAKKAILMFHSSPKIESDWLRSAFNSISDEVLALGPAGEKPYLIGISSENIRLIREIDFDVSDLVENILDRARKARIRVQILPDSYVVKDEESLRKWIESKDDGLSLFAQEEIKEHKKKNRKHSRDNRNLDHENIS